MLSAVLALSLLVPSTTLTPREVVYTVAHDLGLHGTDPGGCTSGPAEQARQKLTATPGLNFLTDLAYAVEGSATVVRQWLDIQGRRQALRPLGPWTEDAQRGVAWRAYTLHLTPRVVYQAVVTRQASGSDVCFNLLIATSDDPGAVLSRVQSGR